MALLRHTGVGLSPRAGDGFPPARERRKWGASIYFRTNDGEGCGAAIFMVMTEVGDLGSSYFVDTTVVLLKEDHVESSTELHSKRVQRAYM